MTTVDARRPSRWGLTPIPARVAERAAMRYIVDLNSGCHVSTYAPSSKRLAAGYAQIGWTTGDGRNYNTGVHRAAWVHYTGEQIPLGMTVDHWQAEGCTSRRCVKREHLRLLTNRDNTRRQGGRDWPLDQGCANGHGPEDRTVIDGAVRCVKCRKPQKIERQRRRRARKKKITMVDTT